MLRNDDFNSFRPASNDQLARVYDQLYAELTPLRMAPIQIDENNWQEYLGNPM